MDVKLITMISIIALLGTGLAFLADSSDAEVTSGNCGENLEWTYDSETYALTISGTGTAISDYSAVSPAPWSALTVNKVEFDCPNLTSIGSYAFAGCNLNNERLPYKITTIGAYAFKDCLMLSLTKLPDKLTYIGNGAFQHCPKLAIQTIPYGVTVIGADTFKDCMGITVMIIPSVVTSIDGMAFDGTTGLTTVANLSSVNISGKFPYMTHEITSTTIGNVGTGVNWYWFADVGILYFDGIGTTTNSYTGTTARFNTSVPGIKLIYMNTPNLTNVGANLFYSVGDYGDLDKIILSDSITTIQDGAFSYIQEFDNMGQSEVQLDLPTELTTIGYRAFYNAGIIIPNMALSDKITSCGDYCFAGNNNLKILKLPENITVIPTGMFMLCPNLELEELPSNLEIIGQYAFSYCTNNPLHNHPGTYTKITTIPDSVSNIGEAAFFGNLGITSLTSHADFTTSSSIWSGSVFRYCSNLESINFTNWHINSIPRAMFRDCTKLQDVGDTLQYIQVIGAGSFWNTAITEIHLSESLITIEGSVGTLQSAFNGCTNLKVIYNESNLDITKGSNENGFVGYYADFIYKGKFVGDEMYRVNDDDTATFVVTTKDSAIQPNIIVPDSVVIGDTRYNVSTIGDGAFYNSKATLTNVTIPNGITTIGVRAFEGCSLLSEVAIPNSVTLINTDAFRNCTNLKTVYNESELNIEKSSTTNGYVGYYADYIYNGKVVGNGIFIFNSDGTATFVGARGEALESTSYTVPESVTLGESDYIVTAIASNAFRNFIQLDRLILVPTITFVDSNAFTDISNLDEVLIIPNQILGYFTDSTFVTRANLSEGEAGYGAILDSANTDVNYNTSSESINIGDITSDMIVSGNNYELDPEFMVYPNDYTVGKDSGIAGKLVNMVPLFVILGILMSLVGAYFVRSKQNEI